MDRRDFLAGASAVGLSAGFRNAAAQAPNAAAQAPSALIENELVKKEKGPAMEYHRERPLTGSVPAHEHDFNVTPSTRMFVRNNLVTPSLDLNSPRLTITGMVERELSFSVFDLPKQFKPVVV